MPYHQSQYDDYGGYAPGYKWKQSRDPLRVSQYQKFVNSPWIQEVKARGGVKKAWIARNPGKSFPMRHGVKKRDLVRALKAHETIADLSKRFIKVKK